MPIFRFLFPLIGFSLSSVDTNSDFTSLGRRVNNGTRFEIESAPYQVSVQKFGRFHICGGSLISEQYVLSAAHCVNPLTKYFHQFRIGSSRSDEGGELYDIAEVYSHPEYEGEYDYDFAILRLAKPVKLSEKVGIIKLPDEDDETFANETLFLTGWGSNSRSSAPSRHLIGVHVPFVDTETCEQIWRESFTGRMICAGDPKTQRDACSGDSGGPLKRESDGVLIGVVSWGNHCSRLEHPGVYAKVSSVRQWIREITDI